MRTFIQRWKGTSLLLWRGGFGLFIQQIKIIFIKAPVQCGCHSNIMCLIIFCDHVCHKSTLSLIMYFVFMWTVNSIFGQWMKSTCFTLWWYRWWWLKVEKMFWRCISRVHFAKIHFGNQSLKAVGDCFQKIYDVPWSTDALLRYGETDQLTDGPTNQLTEEGLRI